MKLVCIFCNTCWGKISPENKSCRKICRNCGAIALKLSDTKIKLEGNKFLVNGAKGICNNGWFKADSVKNQVTIE